MSNLALRVSTAVVGLPLVALLALWHVRLGFGLLVFLFCLLGLIELTRMTMASAPRRRAAQALPRDLAQQDRRRGVRRARWRRHHRVGLPRGVLSRAHAARLPAGRGAGRGDRPDRRSARVDDQALGRREGLGPHA